MPHGTYASCLMTYDFIHGTSCILPYASCPMVLYPPPWYLCILPCRGPMVQHSGLSRGVEDEEQVRNHRLLSASCIRDAKSRACDIARRVATHTSGSSSKITRRCCQIHLTCKRAHDLKVSPIPPEALLVPDHLCHEQVDERRGQTRHHPPCLASFFPQERTALFASACQLTGRKRAL